MKQTRRGSSVAFGGCGVGTFALPVCMLLAAVTLAGCRCAPDAQAQAAGGEESSVQLEAASDRRTPDASPAETSTSATQSDASAAEASQPRAASGTSRAALATPGDRVTGRSAGERMVQPSQESSRELIARLGWVGLRTQRAWSRTMTEFVSQDMLWRL